MNTAAMLEDTNHTAIEVGSGEQALKVLRQGDHVDLVITDQAMPGMTGIQLVQAIRADWPHLLHAMSKLLNCGLSLSDIVGISANRPSLTVRRPELRPSGGRSASQYHCSSTS